MKNIRHSLDRELMQLLICIGEIVLGALLLINPIGFTSAVLVALGVLLLLLGAMRLLGYFRAEPAVAAAGGGLVAGLAFVLVGLFCIFRWQWFVVTFPILTVVYGILTLGNGLNKLQYAVDLLRLGQRYWYVAMIGSALTLVFGVVIVTNPFASTAFLWTFIAVSLLAEAALDLAALLFGRR